MTQLASRLSLRSLPNGPGPIERRAALVGVGLLVSASCATTLWAADSDSAAWFALGAGILATGFIIALGFRAAVIASAFLVAPPGLLGESSSYVAAIALAVGGMAVVSEAREINNRIRLRWAPWLVAAEAACFAFATLQEGSKSALAICLLYIMAAWLLVELQFRPRFFERALQGIALAVFVETLSALVSLATSFKYLGSATLKHRHINVYAPFTFTGRTDGWWSGVPRYLAFSGEPGLGGVLIAIALCYAFRFERGRRRIALITVLLSGAVLAQSLGLVFALTTFALAYALTWLIARMTLLPGLLAAALSVPVLLVYGRHLILAKEASSPLSVNQRGLGTAGNALTDISLSATLRHQAFLAVPILALLAYLAFACVRVPLAFAIVAAIGVTGFYAQPLQDHPGVWVLLTGLVLILTASSDPPIKRVGARDVIHSGEAFGRPAVQP